MTRKFLVVGLRNPGKAYDNTRHNAGFAAVALIAEKNKLSFRRKKSWDADVAEGVIAGADVVLMGPLTYMNLSGSAVRSAMKDLQLDPSSLLVVVDDAAIPLGQIRMRSHSGSGGHNGLKSIAEDLQTIDFARLRIGVGYGTGEDLAEHVLGLFSQEERKLLPEVLERAAQAVEIWLEHGLNRAMDFANRSPSNPSIGE